MNKYVRDILGGLGFVILFGAFFWMAASFPGEVRTYPWVICSVGLLLSALLLACSVAAFQQHKNEPDHDPHLSKRQILDIFLTLVVTMAYVVLTNVLGYFVMTFLFVVGFSYYLDSKQKKWVYFLVGAVMCVILYLAFAKFLNVNLPHGILF